MQSLSFIVCVIRLVKKFPVQYQIRKTAWERERERSKDDGQTRKEREEDGKQGSDD